MRAECTCSSEMKPIDLVQERAEERSRGKDCQLDVCGLTVQSSCVPSDRPSVLIGGTFVKVKVPYGEFQHIIKRLQQI